MVRLSGGSADFADDCSTSLDNTDIIDDRLDGAEVSRLSSLNGKHIAVTGARKGEEISKLIENLGGTPYIRPTQGTIILDESQVGPDIERLLTEGTDWLILTTGIGSQTLLDMADRLGERERLLEVMKQTKIAARGYKTKNFLKSIGITPIVSDDDGTVRGLIRKFESENISLKGQRVALQLYGERSAKLENWLRAQEANYCEIMPYLHVHPPESEMKAFIEELLSGKYDAVAFTSAVQVHFLFEAANKYNEAHRISELFADRTLAVAVGIVTAEALEENGVKRIVQPSNQRMGGMIVEMGNYFAAQGQA